MSQHDERQAAGENASAQAASQPKLRKRVIVRRASDPQTFDIFAAFNVDDDALPDACVFTQLPTPSRPSQAFTPRCLNDQTFHFAYIPQGTIHYDTGVLACLEYQRGTIPVEKVTRNELVNYKLPTDLVQQWKWLEHAIITTLNLVMENCRIALPLSYEKREDFFPWRYCYHLEYDNKECLCNHANNTCQLFTVQLALVRYVILLAK